MTLTYRVYSLEPQYLRRQQDCRLSASLHRLYDGYRDETGLSEAQMSTLLDRLLAGRTDPCDFALHFAAVTALMRDDLPGLRQAFHHLRQRQPCCDGPRILPYSETDLGGDYPYLQQVFRQTDLGIPELLALPDGPAAEQSRHDLGLALELLRDHAPRATAELEAVRPWLLLSGQATSDFIFEGFSSAWAWGAIALNTRIQGRLAALLQVVHELAHQILFALAAEVPLVLNDPDERHPSPLRREPRPLEGILHAYFVVARMCDVMTEMQQRGFRPTPTEQQQIAHLVRLAAHTAADSSPLLTRYARFTAVGERVFRVARDSLEHHALADDRLRAPG